MCSTVSQSASQAVSDPTWSDSIAFRRWFDAARSVTLCDDCDKRLPTHTHTPNPHSRRSAVLVPILRCHHSRMKAVVADHLSRGGSTLEHLSVSYDQERELRELLAYSFWNWQGGTGAPEVWSKIGRYRFAGGVRVCVWSCARGVSRESIFPTTRGMMNIRVKITRVTWRAVFCWWVWSVDYRNIRVTWTGCSGGGDGVDELMVRVWSAVLVINATSDGDVLSHRSHHIRVVILVAIDYVKKWHTLCWFIGEHSIWVKIKCVNRVDEHSTDCEARRRAASSDRRFLVRDRWGAEVACRYTVSRPEACVGFIFIV